MFFSLAQMFSHQYNADCQLNKKNTLNSKGVLKERYLVLTFVEPFPSRGF